ncbi:MAG: peptidyl-prolyl cis-trans isomerase [Burkholderiaceae bacterium]|nr:peptidyl-prolyl cis-trans isomerase [Burkholderiaceae bacterium]
MPLPSLLLATLPLLSGVVSAADAALLQGPVVSITAADLRAELERMPAEARGQTLGQPEELDKLIDHLYLRRAFAAQAERKGLAKDPRIQRTLSTAREAIMAEAQAQRVTDAGTPDVMTVDKLAQTIYKAEPQRFEAPAQTRASHILIKGTEAESRTQAEKLLAELKAGAKFEDIAKAHSADPGSAAKGGDLGFFGKGRMVKPFEEAVDALQQPGDLSGVVQSNFGYHIIRLEERKPVSTKPFEEVRDGLHAEIISKAQKRAFTEETGRLRSQAKGNDAALQAFINEQKKLLPTAAGSVAK